MNLIEVTNEQQFHELRRTCIGGSDAAAVLGLSDYKTPYDVYCEKRGLVEPSEPTEAMTMGNIMEPVILDQFEQLSGLKVVRHRFAKSETHPFVGCNFDGLVMNGHGPAAVVEAKNVGNFTAREWGANGTDEVPDRYNLQVQHAMFVAGVSKGYLMAFLGGNRRGFFEIDYRPELMNAALAAYERFWGQVLSGEPPEITGAESTQTVIRHLNPQSDGTTLSADKELEDLFGQLWYAIQTCKEAEVEKRRLTNMIEARQGAAESIVGHFGRYMGGMRLSNRTIDWDAVSGLPAPIQQAIASVTKPQTQYRHFQPYFRKDYRP